ncbi:hypothetical protein HII31_04390 [Pseudocercospora fuligena]|uniref:Zn(2)-C6 fungal-type domain-containing protein n=1 Tax=Pseudocercospora fuligena TaxID=685502 RepID=A0A8H6RNP2_9PEZI|nr:hypothetical protein HII31_04390 [Pseudocercospora fuligena]
MPSKPGHIPRPRQKACIACSNAKTRCDNQRPCARCRVRKTACTYPRKDLARNEETIGTQNDVGDLLGSLDTIASTSLPPTGRGQIQTNGVSPDADHTSPALREHGISPRQTHTIRSGLVCTVDSSRIQNRWLRTFLSDPGEQEKHPSPGLNTYYFRMLKAWTTMAINHSGTPPFVHGSQLENRVGCKPLTDCFILLRILDTRFPSSDGLPRDLISREMQTLYDEHLSYESLTLFAAFQAYLLYSMAIFFHLSEKNNDNLRQAVVNLQQLACATSVHGVITAGELQNFCPDWESWIVAEAKRRSLYTMYMFDNLLCSIDGVPIYLGTELSGLPAPASRNLWRAPTQDEWQAAYNVHLSIWQKTFMAIDDLWPVPATMSTPDRMARTARTDHWLEGVDEFGTMLYAVTCCTHGG